MTLKVILILPPEPLGVPGGITGAELPAYCAVILTIPPTSSLRPLLFASPGLNVPDTAPNNPATGEVRSSLIRAVKAEAISAADWLAIPSAGTFVTLVS